MEESQFFITGKKKFGYESKSISNPLFPFFGILEAPGLLWILVQGTKAPNNRFYALPLT